MSNRQFLIWWNNSFPYDRLWRKKYNIAFNSTEHRQINQIDVYLDALEDKLVNEHIEYTSNRNIALEEYKKTGIFIKREVTQEKEEKLLDIFDNLNLDDLNKDLNE